MAEVVRLGELDRRGVVREMDDRRAAALVATGLVRVRRAGRGRWRLVPTGRVGAVRIGDLDVQVEPKIGIGRLWFLLGYAATPRFRPEDAAGIPETDLWPAMGESLARMTERALAGGVLHGYVTLEEALPLVRGRVRIADQIAIRQGGSLPLEVRYDEYAVDVTENRLLRTAVRHMAGVPRLDPGVRARLAALDRRLEGVRLLRSQVELPGWQPSRLNAHYAPALRLAEIVLRCQSTETGPDGTPVASFVLSMDKLFEDFVAVALQEALAAFPGSTRKQYPGFLDEHENIAIRPDVVHLVDGRPVAVFDAKYKLEGDTGRFTNPEAYQMLAYCTALGVRTGWLVYAHGIGTSTPHRIRHTSIEISHYPLDLGLPPAEILTRIATLAETTATQVLRGV
jgi:5-methylcytosine-specific restriction enzyme subunit McrC